MGLNSLVRTRGFRNFMAKLYGLGASVVILGALFKINHYPYADIMLIIGLGTESVIFFFSAFEPPHVEPDWSIVYPELAGMYHSDDDDGKTPVEGLDDMLSQAEIDQRLIDRLGVGLKNLSETTGQLADISNAASVTNEYVDNVKGASDSVSELNTSYKLTSEALKRDADASTDYVHHIKEASENAAYLASSYKDATESMKSDANATEEFTQSIKMAMESANSLAQQYVRSSEALAASAEKLDFSAVDGNEYSAQLQKISSNLAALNSIYELQLQTNNEQIENSAKVKESMAEFISTLRESSDMMGSYKEQMNVLTERVSALNSVYGGMLTAMNYGAK